MRGVFPGAALALASLAALAVFPAAGRAAGASVGPGAGSPPPVEFSAREPSGGTIRAEALRGKVVLADFWATWCGPCREEIPQLERLQRRLGPRGLRVLGLSLDDSAKDVRAFLRTHPVAYPVAMADAATLRAFGGVLGLPTLVLLDRGGHPVGRFKGEAGLARAEALLPGLLAR